MVESKKFEEDAEIVVSQESLQQLEQMGFDIKREEGAPDVDLDENNSAEIRALIVEDVLEAGLELSPAESEILVFIQPFPHGGKSDKNMLLKSRLWLWKMEFRFQ